MQNNMEIYEKYRKVPQNALKDFNNGRFKGTDINTMWRIKSLTEEFGMCGVGWYYDIVRLWTEDGADGQKISNAEIKLYVKVDGEWSKGISGVGGNMFVKNTKSNGVQTSDECYKMAITDALGVACKLLGFGADVYWDNDRTKYTNDEPKVPADVQIAPAVPEKTKEMLLEELIKLGADIEKLADYMHKTVDELTKEDLAKAVALKLKEKNSVTTKSFKGE